MTPDAREAGRESAVPAGEPSAPSGATQARLQDSLLDAALRLVAGLVREGALQQTRAREVVETHLANLVSAETARRLGGHFVSLCEEGQSLEAAARACSSGSEVQRQYLLLKALELTGDARTKSPGLAGRLGSLLTLDSGDVELLRAAVDRLPRPAAGGASRLCFLPAAAESAPGVLGLGVAGFAATFLNLGHTVYVRREGAAPIAIGGRVVPPEAFFRIGEHDSIHLGDRPMPLADIRFYLRQAARPEPPVDLFLEINAGETVVHRQPPGAPALRLRFDNIAPIIESTPSAALEINGVRCEGATSVLLSDAVRVAGRKIDLRKLVSAHLCDRHVFARGDDAAVVANDPGATFCLFDAEETRWAGRLIRREDALHWEAGTCPHLARFRGAPLSPDQALRAGDTLSLVDHEIVIRGQPGGVLEAVAIASGLARVQVQDVSHRFADGTAALDHIMLEFERGDMVCILGPSGCGKSTLLAALSGGLRPSAGAVTLDGADLHANPALLTRIGFVPQDDLLQENLTVAENLHFAARLRCPEESAAERARRVERTLAEIDLRARRDVKAGSPTMKSLSGGQRKRLNIGLELVGRSHLLLLDEPTSGLSAGDALKAVDVLARRAQAGGIVVAVVHQPSAAVFAMFQRVVVLDQSGRLAFDGPVEAGLAYFAQAAPPTAAAGPVANDPEIIFSALEQPRLGIDGTPLPERRYPPAYWQNRFQLVGARHGATPLRGAEIGAAHTPSTERPGWMRTALVLLQREALNKLRGRSALAIQFGSAVVLGFAAALACRSGLPYAYDRNPALANYLFLTVIACLFLAISGSVQEIIRDRALLLRERLLRIPFGAYLLSKFALLLAIYLGQLTVYLAIGFTVLKIPELFGAWWMFLGITGASGVALGLAVSALPQLSERAAAAFVPLLMIPQIILAGADPFPFSEMQHMQLRASARAPSTGEEVRTTPPEVAQILPARWAYEGLVGLHRDHSFAQRYLDARDAFNALDPQERRFFRNFPVGELRPASDEEYRTKLAEFTRAYEEKFGRPLPAQRIASFLLMKSGETDPATLDAGIPARSHWRADTFCRWADKRFPRTHGWPGRPTGLEIAIFDAMVLAAMTALGLGITWLLSCVAGGAQRGRPIHSRNRSRVALPSVVPAVESRP